MNSSAALNTFTVLSSCHLCLVPNIFIFPKETLYPLSTSDFCSFLPQPLATTDLPLALWFTVLAVSSTVREIIYCVTFCFWLLLLSMLLHVLGILWLHYILLYGCATISYLFIHVGLFHLLLIVNNDAVDMSVEHLSPCFQLFWVCI